MFVCSVCHRLDRRVKPKHFPVTHCGKRHEWPHGWRFGELEARTVDPIKRPLKTDCIYRQTDVFRLEECPTCCGKTTKIKVYGCELYSECTIKQQLSEIQTCETCKSYSRPKYSLDDITVVVTSFLRFDCLRRFLTSVRFYYPVLPIVVVDQSEDKAVGEDAEFCKNFPNVHWIEMPFDAGISASRNKAVEAVKTRLTLLLDDDHVITDESRLEVLLDCMNTDRSLDLVCGLIRMGRGPGRGGKTALGWFADLEFENGELKALSPKRPWQITSNNVSFQPVDRYINCFVAKTDVLKQCQWNTYHKIANEHLDHCLLMWKSGAKSAYTPHCIFGELNNNSEEYTNYRKRTTRSVMLRNWNIKEESGFQAMHRIHGIQDKQTVSPEARAPNIVVLTVGHTGSTVFAALLNAMGWHLPDNDPEYNEPFSIRMSNWYAGDKSVEMLNHLPQPWVLKDPAFCETLEQWMPAFEKYCPLLIWLKRDLKKVRGSYERRGEPIELFESRLPKVEYLYNYWPWAKMIMQYEDIMAWAATLKSEEQLPPFEK